MTDIFPFKPNWSNGYELKLSFKTDIFKSRSGKEQRRAMRHSPRRNVSYSAVMIADEAVRFQRLMATKQNAEFTLPDWTRFATIYGIDGAATTFTLRNMPSEWISAGRKVFLIEGSLISVATISAVTGYSVTIETALGTTFSDAAILRPAFVGLLDQVSTVSNTSNVVTLSVTFDVKPGSIPNSDDLFAPYIVGGKEVFGYPWNWAEQVTTDYQWEVDKVDFQRGVSTIYRPVDFGSVLQKATIVRQFSEIDSVLKFVERAKGQRGEFWMPSGTADITAMSSMSSGATAFTVEGSELYEQFSNDPVYRAVGIYLRDGRKVFRKITSIGLSSGNSVVNLSAATTFAIPLSLIAKISWLRPARFASDDQTVEYLTDNVAQLQVTTMSVTFGEDPQDYAELDGAGHWAMDNLGEQSGTFFDMLDFLVNVKMAQLEL